MSFPFQVTVYIQRRPHMRDENLEYQLHIGQHILRQIFDEERIDHSVTDVTFYYPERWMNIVEERILFQRLQHYCPNLKTVDIVTQSVYIIQCTPSGCAKLLMSADEQKSLENGNLTQSSVAGRMWYENAMVADFSKLQVF